MSPERNRLLFMLWVFCFSFPKGGFGSDAIEKRVVFRVLERKLIAVFLFASADFNYNANLYL